ncbi:MAG TPA: hypothetical protein VF288_00190 [Mycobacteriales bacterium]
MRAHIHTRRQGRSGRVVAVAGAAGLAAAALVGCGAAANHSAAPTGHVLLVGTFHGHAGHYTTIQAAVDAAKPGDWILIAPGDYHAQADLSGKHAGGGSGGSGYGGASSGSGYGNSGGFGGVLITTSGIHLRGMSRSAVVVDGTKPGSPQCSAAAADQQLGATGPDGKPLGRNGIVVYQANNVSIDNLTVCNFLAGSGSSGNGIWWNGGAESGQIGLHGYEGSYLTATSTYFGGEDTAATYGMFSSNSAGAGSWNQFYASNFNDSGMYVGACKQACDVTVDHAWMEFNALGYSGTNSGGAVVIENSQFDNNQDGLDTNTQIDGDPPAPQNGDCPGGATSPITHTRSCWVFLHNNVHDNNNPNVPEAGSASAGPTGTGMTVSGGTNDTVMDNTFTNNGAWGILFVPYPDSSPAVLGQTCAGTGGVAHQGLGCVYDPEGDALLHNTFSHNGFFGNPSNADFGQITLDPGQPQNCFAGNDAPDGSTPSNLETVQPTCGAVTTAANTGGALLAQVLCDTGFGGCPADAHYPKATGVVMHPLPPGLPSMPDPCQGVPDNPWCSHGRPIT